jgi:predicted  nucleic acid-binding Zn-ribbon protein
VDAALVSAAAEASPALTALVQLARFDAEAAAEPGAPATRLREVLVQQVTPELLAAYERALRAGRQPALVVVDGGVCRGCHMRLHSSLAQQIQSRGAANCPHCQRVVYEAARTSPQGV